MITLLLIIAGVVGLAIDHQFGGQETISYILLALAGLRIFVGFVLLSIATLAAWKS